jgi:hypothetical protein
MRKSEAAASEDVVSGLIAAEAGSTTSNGKPGANRYVMLSRGCACRVARDGPAEAESTMTRWCREKSCRFRQSYATRVESRHCRLSSCFAGRRPRLTSCVSRPRWRANLVRNLSISTSTAHETRHWMVAGPAAPFFLRIRRNSAEAPGACTQNCTHRCSRFRQLSLYALRAAAGAPASTSLHRTIFGDTCARLCDLASGELDHPIFLGHVSTQTTEGHVGCKQQLRCAVNDHLEIEPDAA